MVALLAGCLLLAGTLAVASEPAFFISEPEESLADAAPYLGVTYVQLSHELAARYGVETDAGLLLTDVAGNSPADRAGLRRGDILVAADALSLAGSQSLVELLMGRKAGDRVEFKALRSGRSFSAELVLGVRR